MLNNMTAHASHPNLLTVAPEMARRFGLIMGAVAALVARRFLRDPQFFQLIVPLWTWLNRAVRRFERVRPASMTAAARSPQPRPARAPTPSVAPKVRLPARKAWLVKALGWEAAGYGSQLQALLDEPDMQALLATMPALGRILRPVCRMLGVTPPAAVRTTPDTGGAPQVRPIAAAPAPAVYVEPSSASSPATKNRA